MKGSLLFLAISLSLPAFPQFQGPFSPALATDPTYMCAPLCGTAWTGPGNVSSSNGQYAEAYLDNFPFTSSDTCYFSRYLNAQNFGFSIPANATIIGILTEVEGATGVGSIVADSAAFLTKDGVNRAGANRAGNSWGNIFYYMPYGSSNDLWGTSWTPVEINASTFGFVLRLINPSASLMPANVAIDHIRITVYYTLPIGFYSQTSSPAGFNTHYDRTSEQLILFSGRSFNSPVNVSLFNATGKFVLSAGIPPSPGGVKFSLKMPCVAGGIYLIRIVCDDEIFYQKCFIGD